VESLSGEDPAQDKFSHLKGAGAYVAAVIATQRLLVPCRAEGGLTSRSFEEKQVILPQAGLTRLIEIQDPRELVLDLSWEDGFTPIDEEERRLASGLGCHGADGP
jgi:hypothetical protein